MPDRGAVVFDGTVLTGKQPHEINQLGVARVFQTPEVFPDLTVLENVMVPALSKRDGYFRLNPFHSFNSEKKIRDEAVSVIESVGREIFGNGFEHVLITVRQDGGLVTFCLDGGDGGISIRPWADGIPGEHERPTHIG